MVNAVVVVDMLRGFLEESYPLYCGDKARRIIPNIRRLLERELAKGSKIFFTCDQHDPDDLEFRIFPAHCIAGTKEAEIIPELSDYAGDVIPTKRYSGFFNTALGDKLEELDLEKVVVCGVCTDICVMYTVADAHNRDYAVEVPADCVASFDENAHRFALDHMEKVLGARIVRPE